MRFACVAVGTLVIASITDARSLHPLKGGQGVSNRAKASHLPVTMHLHKRSQVPDGSLNGTQAGTLSSPAPDVEAYKPANNTGELAQEDTDTSVSETSVPSQRSSKRVPSPPAAPVLIASDGSPTDIPNQFISAVGAQAGSRIPMGSAVHEDADQRDDQGFIESHPSPSSRNYRHSTPSSPPRDPSPLRSLELPLAAKSRQVQRNSPNLSFPKGMDSPAALPKTKEVPHPVHALGRNRNLIDLPTAGSNRATQSSDLSSVSLPFTLNKTPVAPQVPSASSKDKSADHTARQGKSSMFELPNSVPTKLV